MALSPDGLKAGLQTPAFELQLGGETVPGAWPLVTAVAGAQIEKMRLLVQIPVDRHHHRKDRLPSLQNVWSPAFRPSEIRRHSLRTA